MDSTEFLNDYRTMYRECAPNGTAQRGARLDFCLKHRSMTYESLSQAYWLATEMNIDFDGVLACKRSYGEIQDAYHHLCCILAVGEHWLRDGREWLMGALPYPDESEIDWRVREIKLNIGWRN